MQDTAERPSVTVIVPALNEEGLIKTVVGGITSTLDSIGTPWEVLLIDDGSTDSTGQRMDELAAAHSSVKVIKHSRNRGLGHAYWTGVNNASCSHCLLMCGDGGLPAENLRPILAELGKVDIVVPYITNLKEVKSPSRYVLSKTYVRLLNLFAGLDICYYNGGALHRVDLLRPLEISSSGFGFQAEILAKLIRSGATYMQVPVQGAELRQQSKALTPRNILSMLKTFAKLLYAIIKTGGSSKRGRVSVVDRSASAKTNEE